MKLNAKQLRSLSSKSLVSTKATSNLAKNNIYIILDNVLDTYNIGCIFRLADAVAAKKIYLCSGTETPPNPRIKKASINTTEIVNWEYFDKTEDAITDLREKVSNISIIAVEQQKDSIPYDQYNYSLPIGLVVGHETYGVSPEILDLCDGVVELPMYGINISLNVMVSLGIVLYQVLENTTK